MDVITCQLPSRLLYNISLSVTYARIYFELAAGIDHFRILDTRLQLRLMRGVFSKMTHLFLMIFPA